MSSLKNHAINTSKQILQSFPWRRTPGRERSPVTSSPLGQNKAYCSVSFKLQNNEFTVWQRLNCGFHFKATFPSQNHYLMANQKSVLQRKMSAQFIGENRVLRLKLKIILIPENINDKNLLQAKVWKKSINANQSALSSFKRRLTNFLIAR